MDADLDRLGGRQHGLLSTPQLHAAGWTDRAIDHAVAIHELFRFRKLVYRLCGAPQTQDQAWMGAVLGASVGALLSHLSAAAGYGFRRFPGPDSIDLLVCGQPQPRLEGIRGHRTLSLPSYDRTRLRFIPATTPERTFVDICGLADDLGKAGDDLLRRKVMNLARLTKTFETIPVSGRRASNPMRAFLAERVKGYNPGGSDRELDVPRILKRAGLPVPLQQYRVKVEGYTYYLDFAWPEVLQTLEWEGFDPHGIWASTFHNDRDRTRRLQRAGWTIWPVTAHTSPNEICAIAQGCSSLAMRAAAMRRPMAPIASR